MPIAIIQTILIMNMNHEMQIITIQCKQYSLITIWFQSMIVQYNRVINYIGIGSNVESNRNCYCFIVANDMYRQIGMNLNAIINVNISTIILLV